MHHTITIAPDRCYQHTIPITADSTAVLITHDPLDSANTWCSLLVDNVYYHLVMWKHSIGRPEITAALDGALADVQAAILALGTPLAIVDTCIARALEEFVTETQTLFDASLAQHLVDKDEIRFWRAQRNAAVKAQSYYLAGVRLTQTPTGYTVPSASRPGALVHRMYRVGGVWACSCEAGERGIAHWHTFLLHAYERGAELAALDALPPLPRWLADDDAALLDYAA